MYIIVGVDTGKTSAIACVDLSGRLVFTSARRFGGIEWFVETIRNRGSPVIMASDKHKANGSIIKLASIFDAVLYVPREDISVGKKKEVAGNLGRSVHERDAVSAAMSAYNKYANKVNQA